MEFDKEQVQQLRTVLREEVPGIVTPIVTNIVTRVVAEAEERIVHRITTSVAEMIEDNILPQLTGMRGEIAGLRSARWRLA